MLFHPKKRKHKENDYITIGWLGAGTELQLPYLRILKKPLKTLSRKYDIKFKIVSALSEKVRTEFRELGLNVGYHTARKAKRILEVAESDPEVAEWWEEARQGRRTVEEQRINSEIV